MIRYTIAVPDAKTAEVNAALAAHTGNPADAQTFQNSAWQDAAGNLYAVCSGLFDPLTLTVDGVLISTEADAAAVLAGWGLSATGPAGL